MSAYLTMYVNGQAVVSLSRNNDVTSRISDEYSFAYDEEFTIDDIDRVIEEINRHIGNMEKRIAFALIKKDYEIGEISSDYDYLKELLVIKGELIFFNIILQEAKWDKLKVTFTYG